MRSTCFFFQSNCILTTCFGIILLFFSCQPKNGPYEMQISLFKPACWIDTLINNNKICIYKIDAYLITSFQNTAANEAKIDSFVCSIQDSTWASYSECLILIYKKSKYTNNEHIINNPRDLDRYSQDNDFLYQYTWANGIIYSKVAQVAIRGQKFYDDIMCNEKK